MLRLLNHHIYSHLLFLSIDGVLSSNQSNKQKNSIATVQAVTRTKATQELHTKLCTVKQIVLPGHNAMRELSMSATSKTKSFNYSELLLTVYQ